MGVPEKESALARVLDTPGGMLAESPPLPFELEGGGGGGGIKGGGAAEPEAVGPDGVARDGEGDGVSKFRAFGGARSGSRSWRGVSKGRRWAM